MSELVSKLRLEDFDASLELFCECDPWACPVKMNVPMDIIRVASRDRKYFCFVFISKQCESNAQTQGLKKKVAEYKEFDIWEVL